MVKKIKRKGWVLRKSVTSNFSERLIRRKFNILIIVTFITYNCEKVLSFKYVKEDDYSEVP